DADHVDPLRHLDAGQLLDGQHIGQVVHHPGEVVDPVGIGDVAVPALALAHLFRAAVVVADLRYAVDDLRAIELQDDAEGAAGGWGVRAELRTHDARRLAATLQGPVLRTETRGCLLQALLGRAQRIGVVFGGPRRIIYAQRVALPGRWHQQSLESRVTFELDAEHVPDFTLVPVGVRPDGGGGGDPQIILAEADLDHHVTVTFP